MADRANIDAQRIKKKGEKVQKSCLIPAISTTRVALDELARSLAWRTYLGGYLLSSCTFAIAATRTQKRKGERKPNSNPAIPRSKMQFRYDRALKRPMKEKHVDPSAIEKLNERHKENSEIHHCLIHVI